MDGAKAFLFGSSHRLTGMSRNRVCAMGVVHAETVRGWVGGLRARIR
jgi:hypothetical protein